ncbi:replication termination factor 2 [Octopus bimaculoides]|uniref:replication termination factor 2 n=1 Tax=Octopus bimaculoides TaxID=37653 RepID=UPI00071D3CFC|nr:replication termination factor 2 [Octopus bimaculoides]|eukprot:XP_014788371.1 PREDICTED: protein RTF2 homolog isoform X1 [Octopus bimaculoides]
MGCDGGTIPTRDELVRTKKKPEQKDKMADLAAKWKHCAISQEPLRSPIMSCEFGRLYNKETVLEFLLDRNSFECAQSFSHLRGLKDIKEVKLTENPGDSRPKAEKGDGYIDTLASQYICPVVGLEMNGMFKFCFPWTCGCVVSERALKEVKSDTCHKCGEKVDKEDVVILNASEEDLEVMRDRMKRRRLAAKLEKKAKKAEKKKSDIPVDQCAEGSSSKITCLVPGKSKFTNGNRVASNTKTTGKNSKTASGSNESQGQTSLQKDSKNSMVYKSLFTSSEECKKKPEQHWITYNPLYF